MTAPRPGDVAMLRRAARRAVRGHGGAEPNPLVGCLIVDAHGTVVGRGHHRRCGAAHAEINALRDAGPRARGATAYVTLEPCRHHGRTGPCAAALAEAGVARVVYAVADPHPDAAGGAAFLRDAGIDVAHVPCPEADDVTAPFLHRLATGRPWVIAKWAQTVDGAIATRTGASRWISGDRSRRLVHRERGRVDAILTGIGTVVADDPDLTARGVRVRRTARRVVVDPDLALPLESRLVRTAGAMPVTVVTRAAPAATAPAAADLRERGVEVLGAPVDGDDVDLAAALADLSDRHGVATVLVEAGAGLLGRLVRAGLVNEAWVFLGPMLLGDEAGLPPLRGATAPTLDDAVPLRLRGVHRRGGDVFVRYVVADAVRSPPVQ